VRQRVTRTFKHREFVVYDLQPWKVALWVVKIQWLKDVFNAHMFGIVEQLDVGFIKHILDRVGIRWIRHSIEVRNYWRETEKWFLRFFKLKWPNRFDNCNFPIWSLCKSNFGNYSVWAWTPWKRLVFDYVKWVSRSILIFDLRYFEIVEDLTLWL
jgi:hypothetical protein